MTTRELAQQVVEQLRGTPFVLALLLINITVLAGFAFTLHEVSKGNERRDVMIQACIERGGRS